MAKQILCQDKNLPNSSAKPKQNCPFLLLIKLYDTKYKHFMHKLIIEVHGKGKGNFM